MAGKKAVIAVMAVILIAVGAIFILGRREPQTIETRLADAKGFLDMQDYDKAIAIYNEIIASENSCVDAYIGLAESYSMKGNTDKANEVLERGYDATGGNSEIAEMIEEMSGEYTGTAVITEAAETTAVTSVPVETTTAVPETTVTTAETTVTTTETSVETTSETTTETTSEITEKTTTATSAEERTQKVPDMIGKTRDAALNLADRNGIILVFEYVKTDEYDDGIVIRQSEKAGAMVTKQTEVYAYVSSNPDARQRKETMDAFADAAEKWGSSESDVSSVTYNEDLSMVMVNVSSLRNFSIDGSVMAALMKCDEAFLQINTDEVEIMIASASVTTTESVDISTSVSAKNTRINVKFGDGSELGCNVSMTLLDCEISDDELAEMYVYRNSRKYSPVDLNVNNEPVINMSKGGSYEIK